MISPLLVADNVITARWRGLKFYNGYRITIALMLMLGGLYGGRETATSAFSQVAFAYFIFSVISAALTWLQKPRLDINLPLQILLDVLFIVLLMHYQPQVQASIGLFLIITVASAALISEGRLALFYAAIATIGVLLEHAYKIYFYNDTDQNFTSAVLMGLAFFAIAWLAHSLGKRAQQSELLASQRGQDVQNLAQINALITHEMQDGVLVVNESRHIQHHNLQALLLLGAQGEDLHDVPLHMRFPEIAQMLQTWEIGEHTTDQSGGHLLRSTQSGRDLRLRFLATGETRQVGAIIFLEDWSQLQIQAQQTKLAALGRLTANIAHEIRNPLSAISHANQLLQEDEQASPSTRRMLQIIADNVQRLDQIIKDVLELNRRDRTNQESIFLESFIQDFYHQFCSIEKIPESAFKLENAAPDAQILFDRRHLNQILWNLCKNGWRHSKQTKNSLKLSIQPAARTHTLHVEVSDDGDGIPDTVRTHLFEPFFTTEKAGTGLGLYIARELAEANGARLQYKTGSDGTQFFMDIKKA